MTDYQVAKDSIKTGRAIISKKIVANIEKLQVVNLEFLSATKTLIARKKVTHQVTCLLFL